MDDNAIQSSRLDQHPLLTCTLPHPGRLEASADLTAPGPATPPAQEAQAVDAAVEHAREITRRVRAQVFARVAFPWRFEEYPLADLAEAPGDTALEDLTWELDRRYREALDLDDAR